MKFEMKNGTLVIFLEGGIDSTNASAVECEVEAIRAENPAEKLILNLEALEYISSAGLRVILKLKKTCGGFSVTEASTEVYEIFEMTGFTDIMDISKRLKVMDISDCEVIGRGTRGTVYRYNSDTVVKIYHDLDSLPAIRRERELSRKAFVLGIPTAISYEIVRIGDSYGSVFELINARNFSNAVSEEPEKIDYYAKLFAGLLKTIHTTRVNPGDMPSAKIMLKRWMKDAYGYVNSSADSTGKFTVEDCDKLNALIEALPDADTMIHGDYHTNNVMMQGDEAILIDMDTLSHGHPIFELANIHVAYEGFALVDKQIIEDFLGMTPELAKDFLYRFYAFYFGTENMDSLEPVFVKIRLLGNLRLLRHYFRRGLGDTDEGAKKLKVVADLLHEQLQGLDSLEF